MMLSLAFKNILAVHLSFKFSLECVIRRLSIAEVLMRAVEEKLFSHSFTWLAVGRKSNRPLHRAA